MKNMDMIINNNDLYLNNCTNKNKDSLKTPNSSSFGYLQVVSELVESGRHDDGSHNKQALVTVVSELQSEYCHLQEANITICEKYDKAIQQLRSTEKELEKVKKELSLQQRDHNLHAIDTFKEKILNGIIKKIKTLKQLHLRPCGCGSGQSTVTTVG